MDPQLAALAEELYGLAVDERPIQRDLVAAAHELAVESPNRARRQDKPKLTLLVDPASAPKTAAIHCPVGFCIPDTARPVEVPTHGQLCQRHRQSVSVPLLRQLDTTRSRNGAELERELAEAVIEARRHDQYWAPWAVVWSHRKGKSWHPEHRGMMRRVEPYQQSVRALRRALNLEGMESVEVVRGTTGERLTPTQALVGSPHQIEDAEGRVIGKGRTLGIALAMTRWPELATWERAEGETHLDHLRRYLASSRVGCQARSEATDRAISIGRAYALLEEAHR